MISSDSTVKIITQYFAAMTSEPFEFRGKTYKPKKLRVAPTIFQRSMKCVPNCAGCCPKMTSDYLLDERVAIPSTFRRADGSKPPFTLRSVTINGVKRKVLSDLQKDNHDHFCVYLNKEPSGLCNIHPSRPFSCDFELLRFSMTSNPERANYFSHRPFGRGWAMLTVDNGKRGAKCEWSQVELISDEERQDIIRKLKRLKQWMEYWELGHKVDEVIEYVETGPHTEPLFI